MCSYLSIYTYIHILLLFFSSWLKSWRPGGSDGKESVCSAGDLGSICHAQDPLEKGMAPHPSILAWRIP